MALWALLEACPSTQAGAGMVFVANHDKVPLPRRAESDDAHPVGGRLKRCLDVVLASVALLFLLPLLFSVALLVIATMGAPVIRRHRCVGFGGRTIDCFRFRVTASDETDPTPLGKLLIRSGIDVLPHLINVLKGDMSCVGPPLRAEPRPADSAPLCLRARPGMTGAWQFCSGAQRRDADAFDRSYVRDWSMQDDILILLRTIPELAREDGSRR